MTKENLEPLFIRKDLLLFKSSYTADEINVFFSVLYCIQNSVSFFEDGEVVGGDVHSVDFKRIRTILGYSRNFSDILSSISEKEIKITLNQYIKYYDKEKRIILDEGTEIKIIPFTYCSEKKELQLNLIFRKIISFSEVKIFDAHEKYTYIQLEELLKMKSVGTKNLFRLFMANVGN